MASLISIGMYDIANFFIIYVENNYLAMQGRLLIKYASHSICITFVTKCQIKQIFLRISLDYTLETRLSFAVIFKVGHCFFEKLQITSLFVYV